MAAYCFRKAKKSRRDTGVSSGAPSFLSAAWGGCGAVNRPIKEARAVMAASDWVENLPMGENSEQLWYSPSSTSLPPRNAKSPAGNLTKRRLFSPVGTQLSVLPGSSNRLMHQG